MPKFHQTNNLERISEVQEDKKNLEDITEEITEEQKNNLKLNIEDLKKKYKRDNRELYHEAIKHNHRKMSDSGKLYGGYEILVQKVFERDLSRDGRCKKLKF